MEDRTWEIHDDNGVVLSGSKKEMEDVFFRVSNGGKEIKWDGELRLIQIHNRAVKDPGPKRLDNSWQFMLRQRHIPD